MGADGGTNFGTGALAASVMAGAIVDDGWRAQAGTKFAPAMSTNSKVALATAQPMVRSQRGWRRGAS